MVTRRDSVGPAEVIALRLPPTGRQRPRTFYSFQCAATTAVLSYFIPRGFFLDNPELPSRTRVSMVIDEAVHAASMRPCR